MSYILEAIKKAEHERGSRRLVRDVVDDERQDKTSRSNIPWVAIAIFINALILMAWIVYQILSDQTLSNEQITNNNVNNNDAIVEVDSIIEKKISEQENLPQELSESIYESSISAADEEEKMVAEEIHDKSAYQEHQDYAEEGVQQRMLSVDDMIDEELPVFLSVKQQKANSQAESVSKKIESEPKSLTAAKIEPLPEIKIEQQEPNPVIPENTNTEPQQLEASTVKIPQIRNSNVPDFEELPYSLQQQIPSIAISVHIYNSQVDARKVRVNGQLLYEGEQVNNETIVEEITPHGVIFDYAGNLFRKTLN